METQKALFPEGAHAVITWSKDQHHLSQGPHGTDAINMWLTRWIMGFAQQTDKNCARSGALGQHAKRIEASLMAAPQWDTLGACHTRPALDPGPPISQEHAAAEQRGMYG